MQSRLDDISESFSAFLAEEGEAWPDLRTAALAVAVSALAYVLFPDARQFAVSLDVPSLMRCLVAGCVAGLIVVRPNPVWAAAVCSAAGSIVGAVVVLMLVPQGISAGGTALGLLAGSALAATVALLASWVSPVAAEFVAMGMLIAMLLLNAGVLPGAVYREAVDERRTAIAAPHLPEQYNFDGSIFLRTYELMRDGSGYYSAFAQAVAGDKRHGVNDLQTPYNYREPFVFLLWRFLPGKNGADVLTWFIVFAAAQMVFAYLIASTLVQRGVALIAPVALLSPFYLYSWISSWFAITEIWSAGFGLGAVACLLRRRPVLSLVFLTAAVAAREFMILLVPAWILVWWFTGRSKGKVWFPVLAVAGPAVVLGAHLLAVPRTVAGVNAVSSWLHGGLPRLVSALQFGSSAMPGGPWMSLAIAVAAIVGAALVRTRWRMAAALAVTVLPTLFLWAISAGPNHLYWGAFYTPLAASIAPSILTRLAPPEE